MLIIQMLSIAGLEIVDEAEIANAGNQHHETDIETEIVARIKKKSVNENAKDCLRLKKNT